MPSLTLLPNAARVDSRSPRGIVNGSKLSSVGFEKVYKCHSIKFYENYNRFSLKS